MDAQLVDFLIKNPLVAIGIVVIGIGCIKITEMFFKWLEKTIKDEFIGKGIGILALFLIMFLFIALCYKLVE
jgi:F0F1-type ATP synthase membrane subunit a